MNLQDESLTSELSGSSFYLTQRIFLAFLLICTICFISYPIVAYDTDLWYHLTGGMFLFERGYISNSSYYSFITPEKTWVNYFWFFQAIIYFFYDLLGYHGLIILRCSIFLLTVSLLYSLYCDARNKQILIFSSIIFMLSSISLISRELNLRPHIFTYLFTILFIISIEKYKKRLWILPFYGILWSNIHGIEYIIMIIIIISYLMESIWNRLFNKNQELSKEHRIWLILTMYTIFMTPHHIELLKLPFTAYSHVNMYINEFRSPTLSNTLFITAFPFSLITLVSRNAVIIIAIVSLFSLLFKKTLRLSHLIMFVAGLTLFTKGERFSNELILLSSPMIHQFVIHLDRKYQSCYYNNIKAALTLQVLFFIVLPSLALYNTFLPYRPHFPFSRMNLPVGIVRFLNHVDTGGTILNNPNTGGYLEWSLSSKYKIYMDLITILFDEIDYALGMSAINTKVGMDKFISTYHPSYIAVSICNINFAEKIVSYPNYRMVYFDENEVLYVDANQFSEIANKFEIFHMDPYKVDKESYDRYNWQFLLQMLNECIRMKMIDHDNAMVNTAISFILHGLGCYKESMPYIDNLLDQYPDFYLGYTLRAQALIATDQFNDALPFLNKAISKRTDSNYAPIYLTLFNAYLKLGRYKESYNYILKVVNPFDPNTDYKDIIRLGMAAGAAGRHFDATTFLKIAEQRVPPDDVESIGKIQSYLSFDSIDAKKQ